MKTTTFEDHGEWMNARRGKITGSKVKNVISKRAYTVADIKDVLGEAAPPKAKKEELEALLTTKQIAALTVGGKRNIGFYELIADRLGLPADEEEPDIERGLRLESEAIEKFIEGKNGWNTGKVMWEREDNQSIAITPDAWHETLIEAAEIKCQSPARHIKALVENEPPEEYQGQFKQYFVVNDLLEVLYVVLYNPLILVKPLLVFEIRRADIWQEVEIMRAQEEAELAEVDRIVNELTF